MKWPSEFTIRLLSANTNDPVGDLILFLEVIAARKNNYSIGPLVTDAQGEVLVTRGDVEKLITRNLADFPMDYASTLVDCPGRLVLILENRSQLEQRVERLRPFFPSEAEKLHTLVERSANDRVQPMRFEFAAAQDTVNFRIRFA